MIPLEDNSDKLASLKSLPRNPLKPVTNHSPIPFRTETFNLQCLLQLLTEEELQIPL